MNETTMQVETPPSKAQEALRITALDGLRGLAILMVVAFHALARWRGVMPPEENLLISDVFSLGWMGVQLFFIISGFVIFMSMERSRNFFIFGQNRWLRLFPAMLVASVLIYVTAPLLPDRPKGPAHLQDLLPGISFIEPGILEKFFPINFSMLDGAFWSIFVEVRFYVIVAFMYYFAKDKKGIFIAFCFLVYTAQQAFIAAGLENAFPFILSKLIMHTTAQYLGWFACGIFFYKYRMEGRRLWFALSALFAFLAILIISLQKQDPVVFVLAGGVYAVFVLSFWPNIVQRILSSRLLLFFGLISYPLYLIHQNIVTGLALEIHKILPGFYSPLYTILPIALVIVLAYGIARLEPLMKRRLKKIMPFK